MRTIYRAGQTGAQEWGTILLGENGSPVRHRPQPCGKESTLSL